MKLILTVLLLTSLAWNIELWQQWRNAEHYVAAKCAASQGEHPILIDNHYHACFNVEKRK